VTDIVVRVADLNVGGAEDVLVTVGLGSCVAIVL
jgi:chemotaxis receptor (MCP) glutamine deamidase CheD